MAAPKIIPYDVELRSVNPVRSFDRPKAYTNDLNSVEFQFKVLDMTSTELTTATAVTLVYMRDGSFFANPSTDVSRVGNVFSYLLKENEGNHAGVAQIQLVVTVDGMELASQLFDFEIINGLETKVAQEVMIYDWTTLTRDAQDYIDQFVSNEATRQQQFADAQTQRSATFGESEADRTTTFNASEAGRTTTFNASEAGRTTAFNAAEEARATGYDADHSRAGTDHTTAVNDHTLAGTDHTTAANDHTLAGTDHTRAEADHTRADADSATVAGFNTRLTAEETATAANKISTVKAKTFADVDARFEDVEFDTAMMGTNLVTNGDFSNGTFNWATYNATTSAVNNEFTITGTAIGAEASVTTNGGTIVGNKYYVAASLKTSIANAIRVTFGNTVSNAHSGSGQFERVSFLHTAITTLHRTTLKDTRSDAYSTFYAKNVITIDLTAAFGKGNEPTAEQMDGIMAKFTNSWFDGTKNLFRANATLNKLMAVDARTEFEAKNAVTNSDFSNGTTGWTQTISNASFTVLNNEASFLATEANGSITNLFTGPSNLSGHKLYLRGNLKGSSSNTFLSIIRLGQSTYPGIPISVLNSYNALSGIISIDAAAATGYAVRVQDSRTSGWDTVSVKYITVIDLTAAFGAGKEPTIAEMDRLMARFPNSWFDGVKPIQTIETLYQEKANKVQEAWITPTLLNGWTNHDVAQPLQYRKDEFGKVHFRGRVAGTSANSAIIAMPVGYKPIYTGEQLCSKYHTVNATIGSARVTYEPGGSVMIYTTSTTSERFDLSALTFSAN